MAAKTVRWAFDQDKGATSSADESDVQIEEKHEEEKRSSWRLSWGRKNKRSSVEKKKRSSTERKKNSKPTSSALGPVVLDNRGAIDENGDYKQAKLEDSNISKIGSAEDKEARKTAAKHEKCFKKAGRKPGVEVWRVENKRTKNDCPDFGINKWPKEEYGNFFSGDSYIVLNTFHPIDPKTGKKSTKKLAWDIHFWLGSKSSQDEVGVAAYKTVELDALLDDAPVQHREIQFHESKLFLSYFKELKYMNGGIESGFRKVDPIVYQPRLLMVQHTNRVTKAFEIPCEAQYMNEGDCFVLDCGLDVYRWMGSGANYFEKNKSGLLQHNIVASRHGKAVAKEPDAHFWEVLKGTEKDVRDASDAYKVEKQDTTRLNATDIKLWRVSDANGAIEFTLEDEGEVCQSKLDTNDCFIVHANIGIWVWLGAGATKNEKSQSMKIADRYISEQKLPNTMTITAIPEDRAKTNALFQGFFRRKK
mmetsp:Transcript_11/g.42  ORF Transcript_11/g.42 Transcript_11/m.42 type:complete len:475 (+) Transcript_11:1533-2957(+)